MSQGGVGLWACGHCREEEDTEGRTDRESEPSLGYYAKMRDYLPQWEEETVVDGSKTSGPAPIWHRMMWSKIYSGL